MSAMTVVLCMTMLAQNGKEERREMIKAKKVAYCTERAGLTEQESIKYWALRNEVDQKKKDLKSEAPKKKGMDPESMTEAELENALRKRLEQHIKADQLELDYLDRFLEVVPAKKFALLQKAEREFKKEVLKELRDRPRGQNGGHIDGHQRGIPEKK